jgi:hypothetical protein
MDDISLSKASSQWAEDLAFASTQRKEIERKYHADEFILVYQTIPGNVPITRLWTIADLPKKISISDRVRLVKVILLPKNLSCRRCGCRFFWTFSDESLLFRCQQCFPRPPKAKSSDISNRMEVHHIGFLLTHEWARKAELSTIKTGEIMNLQEEATNDFEQSV